MADDLNELQRQFFNEIKEEVKEHLNELDAQRLLSISISIFLNSFSFLFFF